MKNEKQESRNLVEMKNFLDYNKKINGYIQNANKRINHKSRNNKRRI